MEGSLALAFALTLFAGLSTGIGSALAFLAKRTSTRLLSVGLGFSAGVMLYVSFVEILPQARTAMSADLGEARGGWAAVGAFFFGMIFIGVIDRLVPSFENPHEPRLIEEMRDPVQAARYGQLLRTGLFTALAVGIHNVPEGLATFMAALKSPQLGFSVAVAIAIHNIPEGIAVAVPIFYATGRRGRAFLLSALSGLAEPLGAVVGYLLLLPFLTDFLFGFVFAAVAGIMVFISLDELLPVAREYGEAHLEMYGLMSGMAVMAVSLLMLP